MRRPESFHKLMGALLVSCAVLVSGCHKKPFVAQTRFLDIDTSVVLIDAWMLNHAPPLFQVLIEYKGANPAQKYDMQAVLRSVDGRHGTGNLWNHPIPVASGADGKPRVIWEFIDLPKEAQSLTLEIDFTDKQTRTVQSVKFDLPPRSRLKTK
jgi:hypothetical protein